MSTPLFIKEAVLASLTIKANEGEFPQILQLGPSGSYEVEEQTLIEEIIIQTGGGSLNSSDGNRVNIYLLEPGFEYIMGGYFSPEDPQNIDAGNILRIIEFPDYTGTGQPPYVRESMNITLPRGWGMAITHDLSSTYATITALGGIVR